MIKGSIEFLQLLSSKGVRLYVASGTDHRDVVNEVKALGLSNYFSGIEGAPNRKAECPKEAVIKNLVENSGLKGENLLIAGDGKVEIMLGKKAGALTLGAATNEESRCGVNKPKRAKLIKAGADLITGDFSEYRELSDLIIAG